MTGAGEKRLKEDGERGQEESRQVTMQQDMLGPYTSRCSKKATCRRPRSTTQCSRQLCLRDDPRPRRALIWRLHGWRLEHCIGRRIQITQSTGQIGESGVDDGRVLWASKCGRRWQRLRGRSEGPESAIGVKGSQGAAISAGPKRLARAVAGTVWASNQTIAAVADYSARA